MTVGGARCGRANGRSSSTRSSTRSSGRTRGSSHMRERLAPNFILLWQSDGVGLLHDDIPKHLTGGENLRGDERAWELVGLYHDEDEAFTALGNWCPGPRRGAGQLQMAQLSGMVFS